MERIAGFRKTVLILAFLGTFFCSVFAQTPQIQYEKATTSDCVRTFDIGYEKLYYLTLAGINDYNFQIKEMQTKSGYIMFADNNNKVFLASIIYVSSTKSILKLTPCDNTYNFTVTTPSSLFRYIEENKLKTF